jgi:hypothetical protein
MKQSRLIGLAATVGIVAVMIVALGVVIAPQASADAGCGPGGPPAGAASKDVSDIYGQPATLRMTNLIVGITTAQGYGEAAIQSASPIERHALLIDAQQDGNHQIVVDTGREAELYAVSGCTITTVIDQAGACRSWAHCQAGMPFLFDMGHRAGNGDGIGCSDLGDGRHLVELLPKNNNGQWTVRRTGIDLHSATA